MTQAVSVTGWPVTVGVVEVGVVDTRYGDGRGARFYTAHGGWLGVVTGVSAASTGGILVILTSTHFEIRLHNKVARVYASRQPAIN